MEKTKETASVKIKIFPRSRKTLKVMAARNAVTMAVMLDRILNGKSSLT